MRLIVLCIYFFDFFVGILSPPQRALRRSLTYMGRGKRKEGFEGFYQEKGVLSGIHVRESAVDHEREIGLWRVCTKAET